MPPLPTSTLFPYTTLFRSELEVGHLRRIPGPRADLHDARVAARAVGEARRHVGEQSVGRRLRAQEDRKSTRLNSSHGYISYAVFCLKKKIDGFHQIGTAHA